MVLPLRVWLNGQAGETLIAWAHTIDISHIGCRLGGLRTLLSPGQTIALQRGQQRASFRVIWSTQLAANENQAGIEALDYGRNIWGVELPPSCFAPKASTATTGNKALPLSVPARIRWGFSLGLLLLGLAAGLSRYRQGFYPIAQLQIQTSVPTPPSRELIRRTPRPHAAPVLLAKTLDNSTPRVEVAEAPMGRVVYPVPPDDGIRGKVRLQIVIAADGVVKQIHALSGKPTLAEAAARAVRLWRYSSFMKNEQSTERETTVTVSFAGTDAVSLEFPSPNEQMHVN
jgi:TonB family protein